jgi:hypothetical protein
VLHTFVLTGKSLTESQHNNVSPDTLPETPSAHFGRMGITLDELPPGDRSFSLFRFKFEQSSFTIGRGCHGLFSADFISTNHARLEFKDQSVRLQISI